MLATRLSCSPLRGVASFQTPGNAHTARQLPADSTVAPLGWGGLGKREEGRQNVVELEKHRNLRSLPLSSTASGRLSHTRTPRDWEGNVVLSKDDAMPVTLYFSEGFWLGTNRSAFPDLSLEHSLPFCKCSKSRYYHQPSSPSNGHPHIRNNKEDTGDKG